MSITVSNMRSMKAAGEKITWLTAYDYSLAFQADQAGVDALLVGDSLGMVIQGHDTTVPVTLDEMCYHTSLVARGASNALIVGDLPFGTYQLSKEQAYANATKLMQAGAHVVKLEGGELQVETVDFLTQRGIGVCGHIGLTPQSVHALGGFKVQGRGDAAGPLIEDAKSLEQAGAFAIVLEAVPSSLAKKISAAVSIPTIGIGAGPYCDGQVLVMYDMLGIYPRKAPKFTRNFMVGASSVADALVRYVAAVKQGEFPAPEHGFSS